MLTPTFFVNIRNVTWQSFLTKSSTLSMRSTVMTVFAWPGLGIPTKLSQPARKRALHLFTDLSDTQSYSCKVTIRLWIVANLAPSDVRNWIMPRCSTIVEFCRMLFSHALPRHLDRALYQSLCSLLRVFHNKHSNGIAWYLATFLLRGIGKYSNGIFLILFVPFHLNSPCILSWDMCVIFSGF